MDNFSSLAKHRIEKEIESDFKEALIGIKRLPSSSKGGVYLAYVYYNSLFEKIKNVPAQKILQKRIRISNGEKLGLMINSMLQYKMNLL
jgi:phytoene/squalene synthetase